MRKFISLIAVFVLCLSVAMPVFAAEGEFVPSITYKPNPEIVPVDGGYIGTVHNADGNDSSVESGCLRIIPVAHVWDEDIVVPEEVSEALLAVYEGLKDGSLAVPYEKFEADLDPASMVIRDLFDVAWNCEEHRQMLENGGILELTFDLGVIAEAEIYVMVYDVETKEWTPAVSTVNNGDGTVTCQFDRMGVFVFSQHVDGLGAVGGTSRGTEGNAMPWIVLMAAAFAGVAVVLVAQKKRNVA